MPSVSQSQQRLFGMVDSYKESLKKNKGKDYLKKLEDKYGKDLADEIKKIASGMSDDDVKDFAKTKHENLPEKVSECYNNKIKTFSEYFKK